MTEPSAAVEVRPARREEIEALRRLEVDAGRRFRDVGLEAIAGDEPAPRAWYLEHLDAGRLWVAAPPGGAPVGYLAASVVDGEAHVDQVSVLESWAGRGVGRRLMDRAEAWARERGDPAVTLTTFRDVRWNGPWYRSLGYADVDEAQLGPELAAIRADEVERGLDLQVRVAMRKVVA